MNPKTAAKWVKAYPIIQKTPDLSVIAKYAEGKHKAALKVLLDAPKKTKIRTPRGVKVKTPQAVKKDLRKELEALCKAIVFTRDCGSPEAREGECITCGEWRTLQWGHFIRQQDCKWLQYDPRNTGGQCARCNMNGGSVLEYSMAIDQRDGDGAAKALLAESKLKKAQGWRPNKTTLGEMLRKLQAHPLAPKAKPAPNGAEQDPHNIPVTPTTPERTPT